MIARRKVKGERINVPVSAAEKREFQRAAAARGAALAVWLRDLAHRELERLAKEARA